MKEIKKANKNIRAVVTGVAHIRATFNNTFVNITNVYGDTLYKTSAGACGFSGSKKSTPYAAGRAAEFAAKAAVEKFSMKVLSVVIRGPGFGAEAAVKALQNFGLTVTSIVDRTGTSHNGCRLRKKRRV